MRIPLDYYRILGLPIQATAEQLQQAYRDRTLQLPRREYSEAAIAARKSLVDEAYEVLSNPEERQAYDARFLAKSYDIALEEPDDELGEEAAGAADGSNGNADAYTSIDIADHQLVGALLILQELGEYELVIKLGRPYLSSGNIDLHSGQFGDPTTALADIVLTVALACLELGREQWQQGLYEGAADSLDTGQDLLQREALFENLRREIVADLYKLRPYRILELLALPETYLNDRQRGLRLLQQMLQERQGIDGNGNDQSGLGIDDFLRFIQQLRGYLTVAEQQTLFEAEARRPSAVAIYLAVYALLARGFAQQQPFLVRRAKQMLIQLSDRQDVHLEQAVCALLLGQTEEASRALELSQEYEPLAFIREHSQDAPDLLPGLCLYAERWLQQEVFPHFRDLATQTASLKDYFANEQVQAYLEELPRETAPMASNPVSARVGTAGAAASHTADAPSFLSEDIRDWRTRNLSPRDRLAQPIVSGSGSGGGTAIAPPTIPSPIPDSGSNGGDTYYPQDYPADDYGSTGRMGRSSDEIYPAYAPKNRGYGGSTPERSPLPLNRSGADDGAGADLDSTWPQTSPSRNAPSRNAPSRNGVSGSGSATPANPSLSVAESVSKLSPDGSLSPGRLGKSSSGSPSPTAPPTPTMPARRDQPASRPAARTQPNRSSRPNRNSSATLRLDRLGLVIFVLLVSVAAMGFLISRAISLIGGNGPEPVTEQPQLTESEAGTEPSATETVEPVVPAGPTAQEVVQQWLSAKQAAFGPDHNLDALATILAEPELARRQEQAAQFANQDLYWGYEHEVLEAEFTDEDVSELEQTSIRARVREKGDFYAGGLVDANESYDSTLDVRYDLVRQDGNWKIQAMGLAN